MENQGFVILEPENTVDNQTYISFEDLRNWISKAASIKKFRRDREFSLSRPVNYLWIVFFYLKRVETGLMRLSG